MASGLKHSTSSFEERGRYCHPDAPMEYVLVSKTSFGIFVIETG